MTQNAGRRPTKRPLIPPRSILQGLGKLCHVELEGHRALGLWQVLVAAAPHDAAAALLQVGILGGHLGNRLEIGPLGEITT